MYPPAWVCRKLKEMDPSIRVAWAGDEDADAEQLNPGMFVMVKLYHNRDAKHTIAGTPWYPGQHGPIYCPTKNGVTSRPDWDMHKYKPFWLAEIPSEDLKSGKIIEDLRRWNTPWVERQKANLKAQSAKYKSRSMDISGALTDEMLWNSQKAESTRPVPVAKKFMSEDDKAFEQGEVDRPKNPYERKLDELETAEKKPGGRVL